jgi:hypothetical protein
MGKQVWPPFREKQGLFQKARVIDRFLIEGPIQRGGELWWAISHTNSPSTFDDQGNLTKGKRECWVLSLKNGSAVILQIEGATIQSVHLESPKTLRDALDEARKNGPRDDVFYGNKGPLSQR